MRVLIAHASEAARAKLADVVTRGRRLSLDILSAGDGPDALDLLLAEDPPEVALIDWDLPGIEAPEMCRLVRDFHHHHDTWVIVLTPQAHRESVSEVWRAGADDCVYTPTPAKLLSDRVTKGLCEMAPQMREAAAADGADGEAAAWAGSGASSPTLDAVRRCDDEVRENVFAGLSASLKATVEPEDLSGDGPAELAAEPAELSARVVDVDEFAEAPRGRVTLDAVLVRL
jgi:DNA-binding response OmpR family regulator